MASDIEEQKKVLLPILQVGPLALCHFLSVHCPLLAPELRVPTTTEGNGDRSYGAASGILLQAVRSQEGEWLKLL
jgi:hypothetical protein